MSFSARNMQLMVALAATMLFARCFWGSTRPSFIRVAAIRGFLGVGVFYYVWYGTPEIDGAYMHWNHSILPRRNAHIRTQHAGRLRTGCVQALVELAASCQVIPLSGSRRRLHPAFRYSRSGEHRKFSNHFSF